MKQYAGLYGTDIAFTSSAEFAKGVAITVTDADGVTLSSLYTDHLRTGPMANPITTDATTGEYAFYAEPGVHVIKGSGGFQATVLVPNWKDEPPNPGQVTPAMLSFDPATQVELDAEAAARAAAVSGEATTRAAADALLIPLAQRAAANGVATLDGSSLIPDAQIPPAITRDSELSAAIAALVNASPATLDTLKELADALGDDPNFAATVTTALAARVLKAGDTSTGEQVAPSFKASGKTGATATPMILGGGTASGAPTTGAHLKGELVPDDAGDIWRCTVAGTPGTWIKAGSGTFATISGTFPIINLAAQAGVVGDGVTDDLDALQAAVNANPGALLIFPFGRTFRGRTNVYLYISGVRGVIAWGASLKNMHVRLGDDVKWTDGTIDQDTGTGVNSMMRITGSRVNVDGPRVLGAASSFTGVEIRDVGTTRPVEVRLNNVTSIANSAFTFFGCRDVEAVNCYAESISQDDLFVLKDSLGNGCEDVKIIGPRARNGNALMAIGSEVLSTGYVRNVSVLGGRGTNIAKILHVKPGGVDGVSGYDHGLVEEVDAEDCHIVDLVGTMLQSPFKIAPGRGATVRGIRGRNCSIRGRQKSSSATRALFQLCPINGQDGINGATVSDVQFSQITSTDPYGGVDNDGTHPGYPILDAVVLGGTAAVGVVTDAYFDQITVDGAGGSFAILDGATIAGELVFNSPRMRNMRKNASTRYAFHTLPSGRVINPIYDATIPTNRLSNSTGLLIEASGTGTPEGLVTAGIGSTWKRTDGSAATMLYIKEAGTGNTGWHAALDNALTWFGDLTPSRVETAPRLFLNSSLTLNAGVVMFGMFTSLFDLTIGTLMSCSSGAAVGQTLARMGLYTVAANGDMTLVARIASDTTLWTAATTLYTKALDTTGGYPATYDLLRGTRYAIGLIEVGASTAPTIRGAIGISDAYSLAPVLSRTLAGQTDLPTAPTFASTAAVNLLPWAAAA